MGTPPVFQGRGLILYARVRFKVRMTSRGLTFMRRQRGVIPIGWEAPPLLHGITVQGVEGVVVKEHPLLRCVDLVETEAIMLEPIGQRPHQVGIGGNRSYAIHLFIRPCDIQHVHRVILSCIVSLRPRRHHRGLSYCTVREQ